jgi:hypothetical protein
MVLLAVASLLALAPQQATKQPLKLQDLEDMLLYSGSEISYSYVEELAARNKEHHRVLSGQCVSSSGPCQG